MTWTKFFLWHPLIASAIALAVLGLSGSSPQIQAQETPLAASTLQFKRPPLSPRGAPGDRTGGGTRDETDCPALETDELLTALVPVLQQSDKPKITHVWGLTATESPTFWFYLPYPPTAISAGEFELWDETEPKPRNYQQVYQGTFVLTETPGIVRLNLPPNVKLEANKNYHWYLSVPIDCDSQKKKRIQISVSGWVQRVAGIPLFSRQLTGRELVIFYAQNGIWQDALTLLAQLRSNDPENPTFMADWEKLLGDVDLENLADKNIAPCCTLNTN